MKNQKKRNIRIPVLVLFVLTLGLLVSGSVYAGHCGASFLCDDTTGLWDCQMDCSTYTETYVESPMTPSTATTSLDYPINDEVTNCTPGVPNATASVDYQVTEGTVSTVSATGTLASTVGVSLGISQLAAVNGSGTYTISGTWTESLNSTWSKKWTANFNVPACKKQRAVLHRYTKAGSFAKTARVDWTCNVREICYWSDWAPGAGSCDESNANGSANDKKPNGSIAFTWADCTNCTE